jgi:dihydroorotate dehydrogenase
MLAAGFGSVECGTVTPRPQVGNPKPRLFRLTEDEAVINRMGFNNGGLEVFESRLTKRQGKGGIVGANLGANKDSDDRVADYVTGLKALWGLSDYFTINISSPNTPGLRDLQNENAMDELLGRLSEARAELMGDSPSYPMFLKVAPDVDTAEIERIVQQARTYGMNAIIISNTTIARPDTLQSPHKGEGGGLSGAPLFEPSTEILKEFYAAAQGRIDLIGVGGISSGAQAYAKIRAGAKAVQLYSALVFQGPGLVTEINRDLKARLKADGFSSIAEAVGQG